MSPMASNYSSAHVRRITWVRNDYELSPPTTVRDNKKLQLALCHHQSLPTICTIPSVHSSSTTSLKYSATSLRLIKDERLRWIKTSQHHVCDYHPSETRANCLSFRRNSGMKLSHSIAHACALVLEDDKLPTMYAPISTVLKMPTSVLRALRECNTRRTQKSAMP